jgi:hypothetical protein
MRSIVLALGVGVALLIATYGALLIWARPSVLLKFHDTFLDRSGLTKGAQWRENIGSVEYRILGVVFFLVGLFFTVGLLSRLPSTMR